MALSSNGKNLQYYVAKRSWSYETTANMSRIVLLDRTDTMPHIILLRPIDKNKGSTIAYLCTNPNIGIGE
jgi:hypothetical protein